MLKRHAHKDPDEGLEMRLENAATGPEQDGIAPVTLTTNRGAISCRFFASPGSDCAAVFVGGAGGGWDSPDNLYPRLCESLPADGVACLRLRYLEPPLLEECVLDVLAGLQYLRDQGFARMALTGWSFGGTVVIQATALDHTMKAVVTVATQGYGAETVSALTPDCAILLLRDTADKTLPAYCSERASRLAHEPKRLILYEGAGHGLDRVADAVYPVMRDWILDGLHARRASQSTREI